jgi:hypothetical protein
VAWRIVVFYAICIVTLFLLQAIAQASVGPK